MKYLSIISIIVGAYVAVGCSEQKTPAEQAEPATTGGFVTSSSPENNDDELTTVSVDTIRYNVSLIAEEDYEKDNLQYLNRMQLVDAIFSSVYNGKAQAYKFRDGSPISIDEMRRIEIEEPEFRRNLVSLLQFTEAWEYDAAQVTFRKRVISVHVAYAIFHEGKLAGLRAGFVVKMNNQ